jgi:hypothetical protein
METENILIVCIAIVLLSLVGSCTISSFDKREKWAQAVKNGADPMIVTCALENMGSTRNEIICYAIANKR